MSIDIEWTGDEKLFEWVAPGYDEGVLALQEPGYDGESAVTTGYVTVDGPLKAEVEELVREFRFSSEIPFDRIPRVIQDAIFSEVTYYLVGWDS